MLSVTCLLGLLFYYGTAEPIFTRILFCILNCPFLDLISSQDSLRMFCGVPFENRRCKQLLPCSDRSDRLHFNRVLKLSFKKVNSLTSRNVAEYVYSVVFILQFLVHMPGCQSECFKTEGWMGQGCQIYSYRQ